MKNKVIPELDKLFMEVGTYRKSDELRKLYEFVKKFPHMAPYNAMLIHIQKPGSQYVASAAEWAWKFKRTIKPGATPLIILRPFGPVAFVFEFGDTEGKEPFPDELINPFKVEGKISENAFDNLLNNIKCDGISYNEADHGTSSAGFIQIANSENEQIITRNNKKMWVKILYNMVVNKNHSKETKFATILHELGHAYCGHLGTPHEKWWADRRFLDKNKREFEAESVCWLVCGRMGIKNPSAKYLSGYLDSYDEIPRISIDIVLKAVGNIENMMKRSKEPRKEIITKTIELKANETKQSDTVIQ